MVLKCYSCLETEHNLLRLLEKLQKVLKFGSGLVLQTLIDRNLAFHHTKKKGPEFHENFI